jgi:hypothetical protein
MCGAMIQPPLAGYTLLQMSLAILIVKPKLQIASENNKVLT